MIEGEYEWWEARVNPALLFRMMYPESCVSFLCDRGRHFDVSDKVVDYIALPTKGAIPFTENQPLDKPTELIKLDPESGWLAERWRKIGTNARDRRHIPFIMEQTRCSGISTRKWPRLQRITIKKYPIEEQHISFLSEENGSILKKIAIPSTSLHQISPMISPSIFQRYILMPGI